MNKEYLTRSCRLTVSRSYVILQIAVESFKYRERVEKEWEQVFSHEDSRRLDSGFHCRGLSYGIAYCQIRPKLGLRC